MKSFMRGIVVVVVLFALAAGLSGRLNELLPVDFPTSTDTGRLVAAQDQDVTTAIQQAIQRSNDEQVQAIAARDSSVMADTVTSDHYQELVQVNQNLLDSGVASINLAKLEWGAVAANGNTASATTFE